MEADSPDMSIYLEGTYKRWHDRLRRSLKNEEIQKEFEKIPSKVDEDWFYRTYKINDELIRNTNNSKEFIVNEKCETNIPGILAAGDVTNVPYKQIIVAAGQGCIASLSAFKYLSNMR